MTRPASEVISFQILDGDQAFSHLAELRGLYRGVYAETPYEWDEEHAELFVERFRVQARQEGFALVEARQGAELVGLAFGVTLRPTTPWWRNLVEPLPAEVTEERPGRTFAVVELLVCKCWRRQHVAEAMHDLLLSNRSEERAT